MTSTLLPPSTPPDSNRPLEVSRFESSLLRVARFCLGHFPSDKGIQLLRAQESRPSCLSKNAIAVLEDTLAKACILFLVRAGGWRNERFLRDGMPRGGRAWDRSEVEGRSLHFSRHVVEFLIWATSEKVHETQQPWDAPAGELTPADELFFWLTFEACRADPDLTAALRHKSAFQHNPYCALTYPAELGDPDTQVVPDYQVVVVGQRAILLECLQHHLANRWLRSERGKGQIGDWKRMRQQGRAEFAVLRAFLEAASNANRPDLARFVLKVNATLFQHDLALIFWTGGLQGSGQPRLSDRLDTQRAALALPRQMELLEAWQRRALGVGFFDDGYQTSQLWKYDWEAFDGDRVAARARAVVESIEPFRNPAPKKANSSDSTGQLPEMR